MVRGRDTRGRSSAEEPGVEEESSYRKGGRMNCGSTPRAGAMI